jgi:hypothetical protein
LVNFVERKFKEDKNSGMAELPGAIRANNLLIMNLIDTLSAPREIVLDDNGKPIGVKISKAAN